MPKTSPRRSAYARLLDRAMRILALRDHSEQELRRKLAVPVMSKVGVENHKATSDDIDNVIVWCMENRYLDDERFVHQFIAGRSRKGYGPVRIRQELHLKGIAREMSEQALQECNIDWVTIAREQAQRKYGKPLPVSFAEKVKVQRFLLYYGYLMDDIRSIYSQVTQLPP